MRCSSASRSPRVPLSAVASAATSPSNSCSRCFCLSLHTVSGTRHDGFTHTGTCGTVRRKPPSGERGHGVRIWPVPMNYPLTPGIRCVGHDRPCLSQSRHRGAYIWQAATMACCCRLMPARLHSETISCCKGRPQYRTRSAGNIRRPLHHLRDTPSMLQRGSGRLRRGLGQACSLNASEQGFHRLVTSPTAPISFGRLGKFDHGLSLNGNRWVKCNTLCCLMLSTGDTLGTHDCVRQRLAHTLTCSTLQ